MASELSEVTDWLTKAILLLGSWPALQTRFPHLLLCLPETPGSIMLLGQHSDIVLKNSTNLVDLFIHLHNLHKKYSRPAFPPLLVAKVKEVYISVLEGIGAGELGKY